MPKLTLGTNARKTAWGGNTCWSARQTDPAVCVPLVLPPPFMPTRSASSPAFSGEFQKTRYFGFSDAAGALLFAGRAGLLLLSRIYPGTGQQEDCQSRQGQRGPSPFQRVDEKRKIELRMHQALRVAIMKEISADTDCHVLLAAVGICRNCVSLYFAPPSNQPRLVWSSAYQNAVRRSWPNPILPPVSGCGGRQPLWQLAIAV